MFFYILMLLLGFFQLIIGADLLVKGTSNVATKFHIPQILIGLTIVALGTSAPELIITITSAASNSTELIIGNAIGSNFCNLLLIFGIIGLFRPIKIEKEVKNIHLPISLIATFLIFFLAIINTDNSLNRTDGIILIFLFAIYFSYPIFKEIKDIILSYKENKDIEQNINIFTSIIKILLGVILLKFGGDFVVNYSSDIARSLNISEIIIGSTIVAIGTAMPEFITSIIAVIRKDTSLAIGNLVGSCVLNILLILGIGAIITPLHFSFKFYISIILLFISTLIFWIFNFVGKKETITKNKSIFLLCLFSIYIYTLFL